MRPSGLPRRAPEKAFESLYRRHFREIFGYTLALLDSPADAEDATQATFLNAYRALERGERPRHAGGWLRAIALNVCREHFRRASSRPDEVSLDEDPGDLVVEATEPAIGDVIRALSHLPFNQRAALVMREFEGRSIVEIAGLLEVTGSAVATLLFRARRALREQLEGSLRCDEAERAISRQLDGALPRSERGALRAHLRECPECASLARRLRAQGSSLKSLALVPVPATLAWSKLALSGAPGGASTAAGASLVTMGAAPVAVKVVGATVLAALAVGTGYTALGHHVWGASAPRVGSHTAPSAMTGRTSASAAGGTAAALSAHNAPTLERARDGSMLATQRRSDARAATAGTPRHNASGISAAAGIAGSQPSGAPRTSDRSTASGGGPGSGHGRSHAYGNSGANGQGRAGAAMSKLRQPAGRAVGHGQLRANGSGHSLASGHSVGIGHRRPGPAASKTHPPTRPPPRQGQLSGNRGKGNAKT